MRLASASLLIPSNPYPSLPLPTPLPTEPNLPFTLVHHGTWSYPFTVVPPCLLLSLTDPTRPIAPLPLLPGWSQGEVQQDCSHHRQRKQGHKHLEWVIFDDPIQRHLCLGHHTIPGLVTLPFLYHVNWMWCRTYFTYDAPLLVLLYFCQLDLSVNHIHCLFVSLLYYFSCHVIHGLL